MWLSQTATESHDSAGPEASLLSCFLHVLCTEGAGADGCINCTEGYVMEEGRCVQSCSVSYYLDHSSEGGYKSCKR